MFSSLAETLVGRAPPPRLLQACSWSCSTAINSHPPLAAVGTPVDRQWPPSRRRLASCRLAAGAAQPPSTRTHPWRLLGRPLIGQETRCPTSSRPRRCWQRRPRTWTGSGSADTSGQRVRCGRRPDVLRHRGPGDVGNGGRGRGRDRVRRIRAASVAIVSFVCFDRQRATCRGAVERRHQLRRVIAVHLRRPTWPSFRLFASIGNVPLAAVLWNGGISFGGSSRFRSPLRLPLAPGLA